MAATANATATACPKPMTATSNGAWQGDNPLDYALPLAIVQICIVVLLSRTLAFFLRPLRQPRVIAEIIGGILLGPSALGRSQTFANAIFPKRSLTVLDTLANIGLLFFLFLVGLELDLRSLRRTGKRAVAIAVAGISFPFAMGVGISIVLRATISSDARPGPFFVFMGVALSITAFPVLARILAELKLLTTDIGGIAMAAAAVNDIAAWILLALAIALSGTGSSLVTLWVLLCSAAFVAVAVIAVRPSLSWMARRTPEGEPARELYICATLVMVLAASFVTDAIGIHALFGAFLVGVVMPKDDGPFAGILIEKIEDLVSGLFLPLYFVSSGLKTNVATIAGARSWGLLALVVATACAGKIGGTVAVSLASGMRPRESVALGFLMNTKGLVELIVLNIGRDRKVLNDETFSILVMMALITTFMTTPIVMAIYKPARQAVAAMQYNHRTVLRQSSSELRILACFRGSRRIPTIINLLESSRGTRRRGGGLVVYAMHLMEFSERSSAISMVHKARRNGLPFWNNTKPSNEVVVAFQAYQQLSQVSVRPMTAISDLHDMHDDIVASAEEKRAALILLPYHDGISSYQGVNLRVLRHAPCSVGVLVDRGLDFSYAVSVLFFGGADDRESLAYAARMAEHPGIALHVVRFIAAEGLDLWDLPDSADGSEKSGCFTIRMNGAAGGDVDGGGDKADEDCLAEYLSCDKKTSNNGVDDGEPAMSVTYEEQKVGSKEEAAAAIKALLQGGKYNLFLVGMSAPAVTCVSSSAPERIDGDWPELGPVGSLLVSPGFSAAAASVLVIKSYGTKSAAASTKETTTDATDNETAV